MQYEVIKCGDRYVWYIYSKYGYPLRNILGSGEAQTKEKAESMAKQMMKTIKDE